MSAHSESASMDATAQGHEPWSCDTDLIMFHSLRTDTNLQGVCQRLVLSSNVGRKVTLALAYRQSYLDVVPSTVVLKPYERCEVRITPKREVLNRLPWHGVISINSQRFRKEVKVRKLLEVFGCFYF
jgi:hypothetical protein